MDIPSCFITNVVAQTGVGVSYLFFSSPKENMRKGLEREHHPPKSPRTRASSSCSKSSHGNESSRRSSEGSQDRRVVGEKPEKRGEARKSAAANTTGNRSGWIDSVSTSQKKKQSQPRTSLAHSIAATTLVKTTRKRAHPKQKGTGEETMEPAIFTTVLKNAISCTTLQEQHNARAERQGLIRILHSSKNSCEEKSAQDHTEETRQVEDSQSIQEQHNFMAEKHGIMNSKQLKNRCIQQQHNLVAERHGILKKHNAVTATIHWEEMASETFKKT